MHLSERDKKLLLIVVGCCVFFVVYTFGYKPLSAKKDKLKTEIIQLRNQYNSIKQKESKKVALEKEIKEANIKLKKLDKLLPAGLSQERVIANLERIENVTDIKFFDISFSPISKLDFDSSNQTNNETTSTNNNIDITDNTKSGIKLAMSTKYTCTYNNIKKFLDYIYNFENRIVIDNFNIAVEEDSETLLGSMVLSFYAYISPDRKYVEESINNIPVGREEITKNYEAEAIKDENYIDMVRSDNVADFFIAIKPPQSELPTVMTGLGTDKTQETFLSFDDNIVIDYKLELKKEDNKYYYSYTLNGQKYPKDTDKIEFDPGEKLELINLSNKRVDANDLSGVNATIINNTDMPLYIKSSDEDTNRPRLNILFKEGNIIVE